YPLLALRFHLDVVIVRVLGPDRALWIREGCQGEVERFLGQQPVDDGMRERLRTRIVLALLSGHARERTGIEEEPHGRVQGRDAIRSALANLPAGGAPRDAGRSAPSYAPRPSGPCGAG